MIIDWFTMESPEAVGETRSNMTYPLGVPLVDLYMQPVRVYKCFGGLSIGVAVLGLQSAPVVRVQHAPVAVSGESTRSMFGDPAGKSASWVYPDWYSPITIYKSMEVVLTISMSFIYFMHQIMV